jgi:putative chitinase
MLLKNGSTGDDVKKLQTKLGITADGSFGAITEARVRVWQKNNGLTPDGIVGDITWGKLFTARPAAVAKPDNRINPEKLKGCIPDNVIAQLPATMAKFNISTALRLAHFLAQCGHESGSFSLTMENLNYSADRLKVVFPRYFGGVLAAAYAYNPAKLGARVYAKRMGNGDEASGEGYRFRGRGYIQLTGKDNYANFAKFIGEDTLANPDLVATKYPLASAAFFFETNKLWAICDKGASIDVVTVVTEHVNGGRNGLEDRISRFKKYYDALNKA